MTRADSVAVVDHVNTAIPFEDKSWVGVDDAEKSPHRGNVYVARTMLGQQCAATDRLSRPPTTLLP